MAHDGVDELALVVPFLTGLNVLFGDPTLAEIDVTLFLVDTEDHDGLDAADLDEAADAANTTAGELREQDHALDVVVLQKRHVRPHVGDVLHLNHHRHVHLRVPRLVHTTFQVRTHPSMISLSADSGFSFCSVGNENGKKHYPGNPIFHVLGLALPRDQSKPKNAAYTTCTSLFTKHTPLLDFKKYLHIKNPSYCA